METCSTMRAHRPRKPYIRRLSSALPAILESRGEDLTTAAQDLSRGRRHRAMVRFATAESPDRGTSAHPPGSRPGRWTPRPPGGHRARDAAPRAAINADPPGSSPACGRPATSEHDQTRRDPVERARADRTVPRSDAGDRPVHAPRPGRRRPQPGVRGRPKGSSKGRPPTQPRTVATERAQYGHPTVPALDLTSAIAQNHHGVKARPRRTPPRSDARGNRDRRGSAKGHSPGVRTKSYRRRTPKPSHDAASGAQ